MNTKRIVITGGPGTGKTVIINMLENLGYYCFHEVIRDMTFEAKNEVNSKEIISNPLQFVDDPAQFNQKLLEDRLHQFKEGKKLKERLAFYDRGIPDVLAYMDYFNQEYSTEYTSICKANLYDTVFLLPPWKEIYVSDNERLETFEEAMDIYTHLYNTYTSIGYTCIKVPTGPITDRTNFILENV